MSAKIQKFLFIAFITSFAFLSGINTSAMEYSGRGVLSYKIFSDTNAQLVLYATKFSFNFSFSNQVWRIHSEKIENKDDIAYVDALYDATNIFVTTHLDDSKVNEALQKLKPAGLERVKNNDEPNEVGVIFPGGFPQPTGNSIFEVWFAYCSGNYLKHTSATLLRPLKPNPKLAVALMDYFLPTKLTSLDTTLELPSSCTQYSDGTIRGIKVLKGVPVVSRVHQYPGCYSQGFAETVYTVLQTTNLLGCTLPNEFSIQYFVPKLAGKTTNDLSLCAEFDGSLEQISFGTSDVPASLPIRTNAGIADYRTLTLNPAREVITYKNPANNYLAMKPGSYPYKIYQATVSAVPTPTSKWNRAVVFFSFAFLLIFLMIIFLVNKKGRPNNSRTTSKSA